MNIERCERHRGVDFTGERTPHREKKIQERSWKEDKQIKSKAIS